MKAIRVHTPGDVSALILEDLPVPEPGKGEARLKVSVAGLNFIDIYHRTGVYKLPLPMILGQEAAGTVDKVGEGVTGLQPGDRVAWCMNGSAYAEFAVCPAWKLAPIPEGISNQMAAAVPLQGMTAHFLARSTYPLKPGDTCVVHAAAGGVGHVLVQIAKLCGARVIGTCSTPEKAELVLKAGADEVILYSKVDFETEVKRLTDGKGVDVVYDSVGKTTFMKSLNCLRPRGYGVLYGGASGQVDPFDLQILNAKGSLFVTRPSLGAYCQTREELLGRMNDLYGWIAAGKLDVRVDRAFPLARAAEAHKYMEARETKGKVVLVV